ncbi:MAG: phosphoribosylformylglycinamidine synthase II [Candidatus Lindowbacteria bacterium RIFCSPLOWO2_12_FULL_62_27]|nr:MAG: phosphoribosylformylglycinamidine synthase II [Candidatus Lindowbacteria bacterium RIFCSPLOWO2_12_FULL_62_27]OGH62201.1 MAG: phosphoribosylformylglycinamidine synthase II [Candidatus Lindowbacteria bacterium RIFCSPLOWO2_02_FULL_62_12]
MESPEAAPQLDVETIDEMAAFSAQRKLPLSVPDLIAIQDYFRSLSRRPTLLEIEVLAQTWSEHCKHRVFNARIIHRNGRKTEIVDGIFATFIQGVTDRIRRQKPGFVLGAFDDNAGFIRLDDTTAACLKVETHNHPSAIEPYAGANTGLGGVIRDILGAGQAAKPVASLDVFCFGRPDADPDALPGGVIHPLGVFRGVVRGVRDYGNRMGIPTVAGAIHFDDRFTCNPLVFCGAAGLIPTRAIPKAVYPGLKIVVAGARTGRDGLHGATFSSASLTGESHESDRQAVQIGNPIEEKKLTDFILEAREAGLIEAITDCGAGGLSSAIGEMARAAGARVDLDRVPLKEENLEPWEIFLSESQERMVMAVRPADLDALDRLAVRHETECVEIGEITGTPALEVFAAGQRQCRLDVEFLHSAPQKSLRSEYSPASRSLGVAPATPALDRTATARRDMRQWVRSLLGDMNIASREPVIREYDFEVQGNTVLKPLAGAGGDNAQDGVVVRAEGTAKCIAIGVSLLPQYGILDPYRMGQSAVDEAVRQVVVAGAHPDKIALLDNFCMGDPDRPDELGRLVECVKGMSHAAETYGAPFISGKDSFHNYFVSGGTARSIPVTLLVTALGVVDRKDHVTGATLRRSDTMICLAGQTKGELGGSAFHRMLGVEDGAAPGLEADRVFETYRRFHECVQSGLILSAHDVSEGGLAVALCELAFSTRAGVEIDLVRMDRERGLGPADLLFSESNGRILFEVDKAHLGDVYERFAGTPFSILGQATPVHRNLIIRMDAARDPWLTEPITELKEIWKNGLKRHF